jgi:hypothetical protein
MANEFKIATYVAGVAGLTLLSALTVPIPDPQAHFRLYTDYEDLGDKTKLGIGAPWAEWRFPVLTTEQRNQLRYYCAGASLRLYIRTIKEDQLTFASYLAVMVWPLDEPPAIGGLIEGLILRFEDLEVQS